MCKSSHCLIPLQQRMRLGPDCIRFRRWIFQPFLLLLLLLLVPLLLLLLLLLLVLPKSSRQSAKRVDFQKSSYWISSQNKMQHEWPRPHCRHRLHQKVGLLRVVVVFVVVVVVVVVIVIIIVVLLLLFFSSSFLFFTLFRLLGCRKGGGHK